MLSSRTHKTVAMGLQICFLLFGRGVLAHTEVQSQAQEGHTADNALAIGHGCEVPEPGKPRAVVAESVLFPQADLTGVIQQGNLAGLVDTIQDRNIFSVQGEKLDSLGNVIGFYGMRGRLSPISQGRVPFAFTSPNFVSSSCVKTLRIELAVADICVPSRPKIKVGKVNLWIPDNGSTYATEGKAQGIDGVGEPPVLVVNRDLVANPLSQACGSGTEQTITPTADEINANLSIPHFW